jgi:hypothetical protein
MMLQSNSIYNHKNVTDLMEDLVILANLVENKLKIEEKVVEQIM